MPIGPVPPIGPLNPDPYKRGPDEMPKKTIMKKTWDALKTLFGGSGRYDSKGKMNDDDEPGQNVDTEA